MKPEEFAVDAIKYVIGGFIAYGFTYLKPKSKLVFWQPHSFLFEKVEKTQIHTQTYTIQNLGRESCEHIEIIHKNKPDCFELQPKRNYYENEEKNHTTHGHIIRIDSLAPKEFFSIEILSYKQLPHLLSIRSKDGPALQVSFFVQQVQPKWKTRLFLTLFFTGLITAIYGTIEAIDYFYRVLS